MWEGPTLSSTKLHRHLGLLKLSILALPSKMFKGNVVETIWT